MIGRISEQRQLLRALNSGRPEFVAVYGRRRVGKTFLVRQTLGEHFVFSHSGMENVGLREQLRAFRSSLADAGYRKDTKLTSWMDAFDALKVVVRDSRAKRKVIFLDELPWMDTPKSGFIPAFEFFWNSWASARNDIMLVVCGSATSWIIGKLLKARGGLHNRVTDQIWLRQFTLGECRDFAEDRGISLSISDLAEAYMILGGVPYYWGFLAPGHSLAQNIDSMFFAPDAKLRLEFSQLYASLFKHPEPYVKLVKALGKKGVGISREEIAKAIGEDDSGRVTEYIEELEQCGFLRRYHPFGAKKKGYLCQLVDNFTLFHLRFASVNAKQDPHFWSNMSGRPTHMIWAGLAFERLCLQHVDEIKQALGIGGVVSDVCAWRGKSAQVDLVIDRDDRVINLCEMKYCDGAFVVDKKIDAELRDRKQAFIAETGTRKAVHLTLVTLRGIADTKYNGVFQNVFVAADLLR